MSTLPELLERAAADPGAGLWIVDRGERAAWMPFAEVRDRAVDVAGGLAALGVVPGERVALVYPTGADFFAAFFGVLAAGAVPVPLYPPVRLGRLDEYLARTARMLELCGARLVLAAPAVRRLLGRAVEAAHPVHGCRTLAELPRGAAGIATVRAGDLALVQFSSGTTVDPKPVALSHRALVTQATLLNGFWPPEGGVRPTGVSWLPLYHDMGLIGCVLPALAMPTQLTLLPPELFVARPATWLRALSRTRAAVSPAPNFAYALALERVRDEELEGVDLSAWRFALCGAEPVAPAVLRAFARRFARWGFRPEALTPVYGLSEAALAVTFSDSSRPFASRRFDRDALAEHGRAVVRRDGVELVSVGRPLAGFAVRVARPDGTASEEAEVGHVLVRGPSLMEGYLDQPDATAAALRDGWLDTGDLGFLSGGELYLTGRAKDVLILNGRNHAPSEVEQALDGVPGVRAGCVVAASWRPDDAPGEQLVVLVEARRDLPETVWPELSARCARELTAACGLRPHRVEVVAPGTLPRTSSGKLRRREALRRLLAGELTPPDAVTPLGVAGAMIRSSLAFARLRWEGTGA